MLLRFLGGSAGTWVRLSLPTMPSPGMTAPCGGTPIPPAASDGGYEGQTWDISFVRETPLSSHTCCLRPSRDNQEVLRRQEEAQLVSRLGSSLEPTIYLFPGTVYTGENCCRDDSRERGLGASCRAAGSSTGHPAAPSTQNPRGLSS